MIFVAGLAGYLIGSLPTAGWLGLLWGVDLRSEGTGNPGTNNARRVGGIGLAAVVLFVELGKGLLAVAAGGVIAGEWGVVFAGIGAVAGNVYNVWYRFTGGKGLAITAGVLLGVWPAIFLPILAVIILGVTLSRSSGIGALAAIGALNLFAVVWVSRQLPAGPWGIEPSATYIVLSIGASLLILPKHVRDAIRPADLQRTP